MYELEKGYVWTCIENEQKTKIKHRILIRINSFKYRSKTEIVLIRDTLTFLIKFNNSCA